jgi:hypothetical protein
LNQSPAYNSTWDSSTTQSADGWRLQWRSLSCDPTFIIIRFNLTGLGAVYLGIVKNQPSNIGGGIITFYLVGTGWLTARRREGETRPTDWVVLLVPLTFGLLTWVHGIGVLRSGATSENGVPVGMSFFMGSICLLAAIGDVRMLLRGGVFGVKRTARHLCRMCFGLFIAAGSFFLGPSNRPLRLLSAVGIGQHVPSILFSTGLYLFLTILPLILLIFWLVRVRFTNAFKRKPRQADGDVDPLPT